MWLAISSVALAVCTASDLTSEATTAKPLPASPARAASMVALSASKLVCPAMLRISLTTSPIFCAPCASPAISPSVARASSVASPTMLPVWVSWRLISAIERDNSSAATAAVSTLVEASLKAPTALSARCVVWSEEPNRMPAVERMAVALSETLVSSASTCGRNAPMAVSMMERRLLLVADGGALFLGAALLGDVLMGRNPAAARQRLVLGEHDAPVARLHVYALAAFAHALEDGRAIGVDVAGKQPGILAMLDQLAQRAARPHYLRRQLVHLDVAAVAHHDARLRVEHAQALRHVVDGVAEPVVLRLQPAVQDRDQAQYCDDKACHEDGLSRRGRG